MLEMKNTSKEMKNAFYGLISRLDTAEEGVTELEYILSEASKSEKHRIKTEKKKNGKEYLRIVGQ